MKPKILIGIETLLPGGAELFVVRLANSLSIKYDVTVFVVLGRHIDDRLINDKENRFTLEVFNYRFEFLVAKLDSLFFRLKLDFSLQNLLAINFLRSLIKKKRFDIIHSNQFKVDYIFSLANQEFQIPHIATIHGDYINFYQQMKLSKLRVLNFEKKAKTALTSLAGIVYISDHQMLFLKDVLGMTGIQKKSRKIYNGIELPSKSMLDNKGKSQHSIFTFGMVARGIPEKGWEVAIQAFLHLNQPDVRLILVGEGEHLNQLKRKYPDERIVFAGYSVNPLEWIKKFHVGVLPTTFASESLPTTIIEYLAMGKPVIATDVGEIRNMLVQNGKRTSGILIPLQKGKVDVNELARAMKELKTNGYYYQELKAETISNAAIFDIHVCAEHYSNFYNSL